MARLERCLDGTTTTYGREISAEKTELMTSISTDVGSGKANKSCCRQYICTASGTWGAVLKDEGYNPKCCSSSIARATKELARL